MNFAKSRFFSQIRLALGIGREPVKDFPLFAKIDERGVARYVSSDVIRWMSPAASSFENSTTPGGRRALAKALYDDLSRFQIAYSTEPFQTEDAVQVVRSPAELLEQPREGTCLDVTLLYCGACLGFGLLPVVVVIRGHALAMVSLTHSVREWQALSRPERMQFAEPAKDVGLLINLIAEGRYIAVECTGFANSRALGSINDPKAPETVGRTDGQMTFDTALSAGASQLAVPDRPLLYAAYLD